MPGAQEPALPPPAPSDLRAASLEALMQIEVTSVSKREETLAETASAVWVITQDDIARSGATTLPEVLRMVPGLDVARIDASKWAVSARGFNGRFADKMLVLIDGRSAYTPLFSGVYWDVQDTALVDIERIEVIRGPGAARWGANAVNGVINIITRRSSATHGTVVSLVSGTSEPGVLEARYGRRIGRAAHGRVFAKYADRGAFDDAGGLGRADDFEQVRAGFRVDWDASPDDAVMLVGEAYSGSAGTIYGPGSLLPFYPIRQLSRTEVGGGHLTGRWARAVSSETNVMVQAYVDRTTRAETALAGETRTTADVEFQQRTRALPGQDLIWGMGFRSTSDDLRAGSIVGFSPASRRDRLGNLFVHDEITLLPDRLRVSAGLKVEHNSYTGWEWQPDGRVLLLLPRRQTVWGAVSRAVRTPSRAETAVRIDAAPVAVAGAPLPVVTSLRGTPSFLSETLRAHEIGYRVQPAAALSIDAAAFYNVYDHLRTFEPEEPFVDVTLDGIFLVAPITFGNLMTGRARGVELAARLMPALASRVDLSYTYLDVSLAHAPESRDQLGFLIEDDSPRHQVRVQLGTTVGARVDVDVSAAFTSRLRKRGVPSYARVDGRLAWRLGSAVTLAGGVQNLFDDRHVEFASTLGEVPGAIPRSAYIQLLWRR